LKLQEAFFHYLGGGFKYVLFSPLLGEDSHFDKYFSTGLKPPTSCDGNETEGSHSVTVIQLGVLEMNKTSLAGLAHHLKSQLR